MKIWIAVFLSGLAAVACGGGERAGPESACGGGAAATTAKEAAMPVLGIHHVPSLTQERYEEVVRQLTNGKSRLESASDVGVDGLLVHVAGQGEDGFWIVDVWDSEESAGRFAETIRPIAQAAGIAEPMATYPVHTFVVC